MNRYTYTTRYADTTINGAQNWAYKNMGKFNWESYQCYDRLFREAVLKPSEPEFDIDEASFMDIIKDACEVSI